MKKHSAEKNFLGKHLLFVTAHPDDESYLAAGTMLKNVQAGGVNLLVCATCGEKGASHLARPVTPAQLKIMRRKELRAVSKFLRVKKLFALNLPDGSVEKHAHALKKTCLRIAKKEKPDYIIGFGKDGISGHKDHIAAGLVARTVSKKLGIPFLRFTVSPRVTHRVHVWLVRRRKTHTHYKNPCEHAKPRIKICITGTQKLKSLRFHVSQLDAGDPFKGLPPSMRRGMLAAEYFA